MKKIELKILGKKNEFGYLIYSELIKSLLQHPSEEQRGFAVEEIRKSTRILNVLDTSEKSLIIEDADYEYLKNVVVKAKYTLAYKTVLEFINDIENAESVASGTK